MSEASRRKYGEGYCSEEFLRTGVPQMPTLEDYPTRTKEEIDEILDEILSELNAKVEIDGYLTAKALSDVVDKHNGEKKDSDRGWVYSAPCTVQFGTDVDPYTIIFETEEE